MATRNRRPLTDEQRTKAEARREQFRALAQQIAAMTDEQRAAMAERMAGAVTIEGRRISIHNACLLACQRPDATLIGGFNQWRAHGRMVRKGEHGLMIWAPTHHSDGPTPSSDIAAARQSHEPGSVAPDARDSSERPHFIMVTVFDVSQTEQINAEVA